MELTCAFVLTFISLAVGSPHGYGVKSGALAKADASAVAGAFGGSNLQPLVPGGAYSGSFSKSSSSSFASSQASSQSNSFTYSGSGFIGANGNPTGSGCGSGACPNAANGLNGAATNGNGYNDANSAANAAASAGALAGALQYNKDGSPCTGGDCSNQSPANCAGPNCNSSPNKCTSGQCGPALQPENDNNHDIPVHISGATASKNSFDANDVSSYKDKTSGFSASGSGCSSGNCGPSNTKPVEHGGYTPSYPPSPPYVSNEHSPDYQPTSNQYGAAAGGVTGATGSTYNKPSTLLTTPKETPVQGTKCSNKSPDCDANGSGPYESNLPSSYNVPIHGSYPASSSQGSASKCTFGNCDSNNLDTAHSSSNINSGSTNYASTSFGVTAPQKPFEGTKCTTPGCDSKGYPHSNKPTFEALGPKGTSGCTSGNCGGFPSQSGHVNPSYPQGSPSYPASTGPVSHGCTTPNCGTAPSSPAYQTPSAPSAGSPGCTTPNCGGSPGYPIPTGPSRSPLCTTPNCVGSPTSPSYQSPAGPSGTPNYATQTGSSSTFRSPLCTTPNCVGSPASTSYQTPTGPSGSPNYASQTGPTSTSGYATPTGLSGSPGCTTPNCGTISSVPTGSKPSSYGTPNFASTGPATSNCASGNCPGYTAIGQANAGATAGTILTSGVYGNSKPGVGASSTSHKQPVYTGGFGGPSGLLKPNDYSLPSKPFSPVSVPSKPSYPTTSPQANLPSHVTSSPGNVPKPPTVPSYNPSSQPAPASCITGNCASSLPHYNHGGSSNNAVASAVAGVSAVAYTGGFGGPPGLLKPYDGGKAGVGIQSSQGSKYQGDSQNHVHGASHTTPGSGSYGSSSNGASAAAQSGAVAGAFSGGFGHQGGHGGNGINKNEAGGCNSGCGSGGNGYGSHNSGLDLAGLHGAGGSAKSQSGALSGAGAGSYSQGGSFASSSASAHASAGAATKGGYGRR